MSVDQRRSAPGESLRWMFGQSYRRSLQLQDRWHSHRAPVDGEGTPVRPGGAQA